MLADKHNNLIRPFNNRAFLFIKWTIERIVMKSTNTLFLYIRRLVQGNNVRGRLFKCINFPLLSFLVLFLYEYATILKVIAQALISVLAYQQKGKASHLLQ